MYLNCHSYYSFKFGTLSIEQLLLLAQTHQQKAIALTDINNTSGCLSFVQQAKEAGIKPIIGIDFRKGAQQHFVGLARSNKGFQSLNEYLSDILVAEEEIPLRAKQMEEVSVIYPFAMYSQERIELGVNEYIGIAYHELKYLPFSVWKNCQEQLVFRQTVTVSNRRAYNVHRLLRAIDQNILLAKLHPSTCGSPDDRVYTAAELEPIQKNHAQIWENTQQLMESCSIDFQFKGNKKSGAVNQNKQTFTASNAEDRALLRKLCYDALDYRYPDEAVQAQNMDRLEKELKAINSQGFESYFLINWDMLRYARSRGFFYVGRGSGANSIVAYLLRITDVDPVKLDLYFERFINPYRENPPDFDIDFSWRDRDEVTQYLFRKYGENNQIALLATYNTFQYRSLIRELGKVFGLPSAEIDALSREKQPQAKPDQYVRLIYKYAAYMHGMPSHLSVHAGGILIAEKSIHYFSATIVPPKGFPLVQFDMIHAEDVGLYKFDILSQRGLGKVKDSMQMVIDRGKERDLDIHKTERFFEDEKIKALLREGNTMGCFYVESPAMRMLLKKLKADDYLSLVAASSIIRPGVAKSGMMREYILRSQSNSEDWREKTPHIMQELMEETYGVMVYQEDVIKVAHHFAGLSLGEADVLRRGMSGKFRSRTEFAKVKQQFFDNCTQKGYPPKLTQEVWRQTESFAGYAFSKGHSASYAVESYQSLYLKAHYPMEFILGVLNNGGGFYSREMYFHEARMMGATVEPPCINTSQYLSCLVGESTIYMGFHLVGELEQQSIQLILDERKRAGSYRSLVDFIGRCEIAREQLSLLIRASAFRFSGKSKQILLWEMYQLLGHSKKTQVRKSLFESGRRKFHLPQLDRSPIEEAYDQMELFGFALCSPFDLLAENVGDGLKAKDILNHLGQRIQIVGSLVCIKKTRTTRKELMQFGTFVDANGDWIDTVHFPPVVKRYPFEGKGCYVIEGKVVEEFGYPTVEVTYLRRLSFVSRDHPTHKKQLAKT